MKGRPFIYLLAVALAVLTTAARAAAPVCSLSAPEVRKEIRAKGTDEFMNRLWQDHTYKASLAFEACVSTGKKEWLDIAKTVLETTETDTEDDLTTMVGDAIPNNAEAVLAEPWPTYFTLGDYICSGNLIEEFDSYDLAIAELNRRVAMVQKIRRPALKNQINECLAGYEKARKDIARWFEVDQPSDNGDVSSTPDPSTAPPPPFIGKG